MKPRYRGECGQCDFVAASATRMEQHLLTHGIVLSTTSANDSEVAKPRPRKKGRRKRSSLAVKVEIKEEPEFDKEETGDNQESIATAALSSSAKDEHVPAEVGRVEDTKVPVTVSELKNDGCDTDMQVKKKVVCNDTLPKALRNKSKMKKTPSLSDSNPQSFATEVKIDIGSVLATDDVDNLPRLDVLTEEALPQNLELDDAGKEDHMEDILEEENFCLNLSDANTSTSSTNIFNYSDIVNTSDTLSLPDDVEARPWCVSPEIKQEKIDSEYENRAFASPHPSKLQDIEVTKTPPDHDYIKCDPGPPKIQTSEDPIPNSVKEEFMMNCVSIKQEDFDKMCSVDSDSESGVIVIAPQDDEEKIDEICSMADANTLVKKERIDNNENYEAGEQPNRKQLASDDLIKTSVLRSILMGEVVPPGQPRETSDNNKDKIARDQALKERKMYSLPCMLTPEKKLRLVPATCPMISHYIVVAPAAQGRSPGLFLVPKAKVQNVDPQTGCLQGVSKPKKKAVAKSPPSAKLKKARSALSSVLAKAHGTDIDAIGSEVPATSSDFPVQEKKEETPDTKPKLFCCRNDPCGFMTPQYYSYQSHVMHCWQDHGFMVCDDFLCEEPFRTKCAKEFKQHCRLKHPELVVHACAKCMYLAASKEQISSHQAMYHMDLYAPESPFPAFSNSPKKPNIYQKNYSYKPNNKKFTTKSSLKSKNGSGEKMSLSLTHGLGSITNAAWNTDDVPTSIQDIARVRDHYSVNIKQSTGVSEYAHLALTSKLASKKVKDLLNLSPKSSTPPSEVKDVCYSAKKLEMTLEPAAKILTQTVQAKCLLDLAENYQHSLEKQVVDVHIKQEPTDTEDPVKDRTTCNTEVEKDAELVKQADEDEQLTNELTQPESQKKQEKDSASEPDVAEESVNLPESAVSQESINMPESAVTKKSYITIDPKKTPEKTLPEPDFDEEYFDGTVEDNFVFDDNIDLNATSEDFFSEEFDMQNEADEAEECDNSASKFVDGSLVPPADEEGVKKLQMEDENGKKTEVLLQPLVSGPRKSQRVPKRKVYCTDACCVDSGSKRRRVHHTKKVDKAKTGFEQLSRDQQLMNMKLCGKPVVVLIDIMALVRPLLGLDNSDSEIINEISTDCVTYTGKQTARKSTGKRSRVVKKSRCSCCAD